MEQCLTIVTVGVGDVAASRRFYVDGLGWTPVLDRPEVLFFQVGHGLVLGLWDREEMGAELGEPVVAGTSVELACNVDSDAAVDDAVARVEAAGGTVLKPPRPAFFGGHHAYVADPDGTRWEIAHNPGLTVDVDGSVRFG